ncbi:MAG: MerR family transcriptional regulator [Bacillati bacterium ANGP1]|uniref:MerR family transcriptional regulator n=1 Tax=Candidatus Segetimicrobium genomatis TaxID=2569760 RepID=A0A537KSN8_9BACT|nr:MAG: MerR family transcriptional regulator [Terrabacteria group bacterium ANGP1]
MLRLVRFVLEVAGVRSRRDDLPVYVISVAADLLGLHPRTLRIYEEKGLVQPARRNHQRLYSERDLERVRSIRHLTQEMGLNLAGVRVLMEIHERMELRGSKDVVSWVVERTVRRRRVP